MKLHYKGKYNLDPNTLPYSPHKPNAVPFKEPKDSKTLGLIANGLSFVILIPLGFLLYLRYGIDLFGVNTLWGFILLVICMFPHELLHALCFREDVYLYTNLKQGMLFVVGPENMSKSRFIFMSLLPNLVFGFIPYIISLIFPFFPALGVLGGFAISMGAGDYFNIFNALTQMPKKARTYLYKFNSFWYLP